MNQNTRRIMRQAGIPAAIIFAFALSIQGVAAIPDQGKGDDAQIEVEWHDDDMGFNVTSSKGLSNLIVEYCDGKQNKLEFKDDDRHNYTWEDDQVIVGVWVKSGANHDKYELAPPGAGERFDNEGVECGEIPNFPTIMASGLAIGLGVVGYAVMRRR